jgi:hypothetical protein
MAETQSEKPTPPYISYATYKNYLTTLKKAIPGRIDKSVMTSLSGANQTQLLHALKYLKLIDGNGAPQEKLALLVNSEGADRQKVQQDILRAAYPFLNDTSFRLETATTGQLGEQFAKLAQGDTVRKCKTFFLPAAKEAGLTVSPYIKEVGKRTPSNGKTRKPRAATAAPAAAASVVPGTGASTPPVMSWHELLLTKFPSFDPSWPDDVKAKWFVSFQDLMSKGPK